MQLTDLASVIVSDSVAALNTTLFLAPKPALPTDPATPAAFAVLSLTGGSGPDWIHNKTHPAHRKPGMQVLVHGLLTSDAFALAEAIYQSLTKIVNQTINGTKYLSVVPLNEPNAGMPVDDLGRVQIVFNVLITYIN